MELLCFYKICNYICGACPSPCFSSLIYYKGIQVCDGIGIPLFFNMEKINVFDVQIPDGRQIRCMSYNKVTYFDLDDVMSEFLHRDGDRYWVMVDGVRQLYRRVECKMCFEVIEKLRGL